MHSHSPPNDKLHMCSLQQCLLAQWLQVEGQWENLVLIRATTHCCLQWWNSNNLLQGLPFADPIPQVTTDASLSGWGAHLQELIVEGM